MNAAERAEALARVRTFLLQNGATPAQIDEAERNDVLDLLVADRLLVPSDDHYTEAEVAERTGMPVELARKFWRALGFADVEPEDRAFSDFDVEAILTINAMVALGVADVDGGLQLARVIGSSMARIADAMVSPASTGGPMGPIGSDDSVEAADLFARLADDVLPAMAGLLEFAWRRHVQAATRRTMLIRARTGGALPSLCVGFADMVGFTMLSQQLSEDELAVVVSRFEELAHDTVTAAGGRLVKMIGDEAMFVSESPVAAGRIALQLAEAYADDELLSDVRVGMAVGPVLVQDGDYYGPVVNLAHRIVTMAQPGTVLVSDELHQVLLHEGHPAGMQQSAASAQDVAAVTDEFGFRPLRPRVVKDVGRVHLWVLQRPGAEPVPWERRMGRRFERLSEVLHDIEDLRDRGERLLTSGLRAAVDSDDRPGDGDD